jgi:Tetracyclin repressor-like, C-terminal domain
MGGMVPVPMPRTSRPALRSTAAGSEIAGPAISPAWSSRTRPARSCASWCLRAGEVQARTAGADPAHAAAITAYINDQLATGRFPHLSSLAHDPAARTIVEPGQLDQRFERGLRALLDGAVPG